MGRTVVPETAQDRSAGPLGSTGTRLGAEDVLRTQAKGPTLRVLAVSHAVDMLVRLARPSGLQYMNKRSFQLLHLRAA